MSQEDGNMHQTNVEQASKYLFTAMLAFGLIFIKPNHGKWTWKAILSVLYYAAVLLILWGNVLRYFWAYDPDEHFSPQLTIKIGNHLVWFFIALYATFTIKLSLRKHDMMAKWTNYFVTHNVDPTGAVTKMRRRSIIYIGATLASFTLTLMKYAIEFSVDTPVSLTVMQLLPFSRNRNQLNEIPIPVIFVMFVVELWSCALFCLVLSCMSVLGLALRDEFEQISQDFREKYDESTEMFEMFRSRHLELSNVVADSDQVISCCILLTFAWVLTLTCGNIYVLILVDLDPVLKYIWIRGLMLGIAPMFPIVLIGSTLHEKVSLSNDSISCMLSTIKIYHNGLSSMTIFCCYANCYRRSHCVGTCTILV
jgi:hypothetical protein